MAVSPTLEIEGLNKLLRALEKLDDAAKDEFKEVGLKVGKFVADRAKGEAPTLSGKLRGTIRPVATRRGAKIRAGSARVPYAGVIHFGWRQRNIEKNQFMYRAVDKSVDEAVDMYLKEIYSIWNRNV
jgi:hypothetical protein